MNPEIEKCIDGLTKTAIEVGKAEGRREGRTEVLTALLSFIETSVNNDGFRFANVSCSQCGRTFGPGDHGYSHCENHAGKVATS